MRLVIENEFLDEAKAMNFNEITEKVPWDILAGRLPVNRDDWWRAGFTSRAEQNRPEAWVEAVQVACESVEAIAKRKEMR